ncbi:MAG: hypothetical protein ISF22_11210 [Methanomassiliicoccus sp.]|nr:hypothetical protein [Methanomassiliicoccus sp.]
MSKHYVLRTLLCPSCGHAQEIKFKLSEVQVVERCEACGKVARFERVPLGADSWNVICGQ